KVARPGAHWWTPSRAHGWLPPVILHPGPFGAVGTLATRISTPVRQWILGVIPPVDTWRHSPSGCSRSACGRILFGPHFGAGKFSKTLLQPVIAGLQRAGKVPN